MAKTIEAATQLWAQIFARMAQDEWATLVDPDHDAAHEEEKIRRGMAASGWLEGQIDALVAEEGARIRSAAVTSPNVNPHVEVAFGRLCTDVETAMARLGHSSHLRVGRGVEPRIGPVASMTNVIMTDEAVVTVGAFFFRYCGLIARAFARSLRLDAEFWESRDWDSAAAVRLMAREAWLMDYWFQIQLSYAATGTHVLTPYVPSTPQEVALMEMVARAMEIFAIAHEYGHHHLDHGRTMDGDLKRDEFAADQFALRVGYEIERHASEFPNPYLQGGSGGVILLSALEMLRRVGEVVLGRPVQVNTTHPETPERIARFDTVALLQPAEFAQLQQFRRVSSRIMGTVETLVIQRAQEAPSTLRTTLRAIAAPL